MVVSVCDLKQGNSRVDGSDKMDVDEEGDCGDQNGDHEDNQEAGEAEEGQEARYHQEDENAKINEGEYEDVSEVEYEAEDWEQADDEDEDDGDEDDGDRPFFQDQDEEYYQSQVELEYQVRDQDLDQQDDHDMDDLDDDEFEDNNEGDYGKDEDPSEYHYSTENEVSNGDISDREMIQSTEMIEGCTRTIEGVLSSAHLPLSLQKSPSCPVPSKKKGSLTKIVDKVTNFCKKALPRTKASAKKEKADVRNPPIPPWAEVYEEGGKTFLICIMEVSHT